MNCFIFEHRHKNGRCDTIKIWADSLEEARELWLSSDKRSVLPDFDVMKEPVDTGFYPLMKKPDIGIYIPDGVLIKLHKEAK